jgi:apolipoprotein N-acyltransferase
MSKTHAHHQLQPQSQCNHQQQPRCSLLSRLFTPRWLPFTAFFAGALLPLAFAPFALYVLAIIAPATLLYIWIKTATPRRAFWYGWLFGIGCFGVGTSWIYVSLHDYGYMTVPLASIATVLFVLFFALFPAVNGYCLTRFFPHNNLSKLLLAFPALWVACEWIRSWFVTGFPWLLLGYSQVDSPLRSIAPIFGIYGVSFAAAFTAAVLVTVHWANKNSQPKQKVWAIVLVILLWGIAAKLCDTHWTKPASPPIEVTLVQGNIPQEIKWLREQRVPIMEKYYRLSQKHWGDAIIIWPEASIPALPEEVAPFLKKLETTAKQHHATVILGLPLDKQDQHELKHIADNHSDDDGKQSKTYNAIIALGTNQGKYLKRHLVPFGEYTPLQFIFNRLMTYFTVPMSNFSAGPMIQPPLMINGIALAPFICYEIAYPQMVLDYFDNATPAQLLLTLADDSWFGRSIAAAQHFEIARMRSLESGRYQLLSTSTGVTAIISDIGRVVDQVMPFQEATLSNKVVAHDGKTPWVRWGRYGWMILVSACLLLSWLRRNS